MNTVKNTIMKLPGKGHNHKAQPSRGTERRDGEHNDSLLLLFRSPWDSLKYFEISVSDLQNWGENKSNNHISQKNIKMLLK